MPLYKTLGEPTWRMGILWTIAGIRNAAVLEFGSMGHLLYSDRFLQEHMGSNRATLYSTHINEKTIAFGIGKELELAIYDIYHKQKPEVLFILPSVISLVTGMDVASYCEELQETFPQMKIIQFSSGGFEKTYSYGKREANYQVVKQLVEKEAVSMRKMEAEKISFNLIGLGIDVPSFKEDIKELKRILHGVFDAEINCVLMNDCSVKDIRNMNKAKMNLVLYEEGLKAAKLLEKEVGQPYIYGCPTGFSGTNRWLYRIAESLQIQMNHGFLKSENRMVETWYKKIKDDLQTKKNTPSFALYGNMSLVESLCFFLEKELGLLVSKVACTNRESTNINIPYCSQDDMYQWKLNQGEILLASENAMIEHGHSGNLAILNSLNVNHEQQHAILGFQGAMFFWKELMNLL